MAFVLLYAPRRGVRTWLEKISRYLPFFEAAKLLRKPWGLCRPVVSGVRIFLLLFPENEGTKDLADEKHTKAPEGAAAGTLTGGAIGGILGGLIGIGLIAIPGLGPLVAAGPIIAALTGVGSGTVVGGVIGALVGLGIPEYEAKRYEGRIKQGGLLLSVHCDNDDWVKRARPILERSGGEEISATGEATADYAVSDKPLPRVRRAGATEPSPVSLDRLRSLPTMNPATYFPSRGSFVPD